MLLFFFLHFVTPLPFDRLREETVGGRTWIILLLLYENSLCFVIQTYTNNINKNYKETSQNIYLR